MLLRKFPPPPDPATVAANARHRAAAATRNKCPVCQTTDHPTQRRSRGRWRGYCEPCARNAENARRRELRHFLRIHDHEGCEDCWFVPADRHRPPAETLDYFPSHRKCEGCRALFTPKRSDSVSGT